MGRHRVHQTHTIAAPIDQVWAVIDDTSRYADWVDGALEVTSNHGRATVGQAYTERNKTIGPLSTTSTWTVREIKTNRLRVDAGEGFAPLQNLVNTFRFAEADGGSATDMTYEVEFDLPLDPFSRPVASLLKVSLAAEFKRSMVALDLLVRSENDIAAAPSSTASEKAASGKSNATDEMSG